uniref:Uncharacterized protein n=1 Tax=Ditylenchus dipsaci TaxID=166011 RepID=A0A915EI86_9BILA
MKESQSAPPIANMEKKLQAMVLKAVKEVVRPRYRNVDAAPTADSRPTITQMGPGENCCAEIRAKFEAWLSTSIS